MLFRLEWFRLEKKITEVITGSARHDFLVFLTANFTLQLGWGSEARMVLTHQA